MKREVNGQTIIEWCREHNVTKGSYHYWRRQVLKAERFDTEPILNTSPDTGPIIFAKLERNEPVPPALLVTLAGCSDSSFQHLGGALSGKADLSSIFENVPK